MPDPYLSRLVVVWNDAGEITGASAQRSINMPSPHNPSDTMTQEGMPQPVDTAAELPELLDHVLAQALQQIAALQAQVAALEGERDALAGRVAELEAQLAPAEPGAEPDEPDA